MRDHNKELAKEITESLLNMRYLSVGAWEETIYKVLNKFDYSKNKLSVSIPLDKLKELIGKEKFLKFCQGEFVSEDFDTRKDMEFRGKYVTDINELGEASNEFSNLRFEGE